MLGLKCVTTMASSQWGTSLMWSRWPPWSTQYSWFQRLKTWDTSAHSQWTQIESDLQWQATDRTLPDNLAGIAGELSKISEIISTWLWELYWQQHWILSICLPQYPNTDLNSCKYMYIYYVMVTASNPFNAIHPLTYVFSILKKKERKKAIYAFLPRTVFIHISVALI